MWRARSLAERFAARRYDPRFYNDPVYEAELDDTEFDRAVKDIDGDRTMMDGRTMRGIAENIQVPWEVEYEYGADWLTALIPDSSPGAWGTTATRPTTMTAPMRGSSTAPTTALFSGATTATPPSGTASTCAPSAAVVAAPTHGSGTVSTLLDARTGITPTGASAAYEKHRGHIKTMTPHGLDSSNFHAKLFKMMAPHRLGADAPHLGVLALFIGLIGVLLIMGSNMPGPSLLLHVALAVYLMNVHLAACVNGGGMPMFVMMLSSHFGWTLVAEGFLLRSTVLVIKGSVIGFVGAARTKIRYDTMDRDSYDVLFRGFSTKADGKSGDSRPREVTVANRTSAPVATAVATADTATRPRLVIKPRRTGEYDMAD